MGLPTSTHLQYRTALLFVKCDPSY